LIKLISIFDLAKANILYPILGHGKKSQVEFSHLSLAPGRIFL
jgi:hypothetical protein